MEDFEFEDMLERRPIVDKSVIGTQPILAPIDILKTYSFEEFEEFVLEWASSFLESGFHVLKRGGAGDKGIDVLVSNQRDKHIFYQCKKYASAFNLSDTIKEIGKICYYSFIEKIPKPSEYYLVAYSGLSEETTNFFNNKETIASVIINKWDNCCKDKITSTKEIPLSVELKEYIKNFDFSNFSYKGIMEILNEHQKTIYFAFRFGDKLTINRPITIVPDNEQQFENTYIQKLFEVYSEVLDTQIESAEQLKSLDAEMYKHFQAQRERFFNAENLRLFAKDSMMLESEFTKLKEEIYDTIIESLYNRNFTSYERLSDCLKRASDVAVTDNLLTKCGIVTGKDRRGICHHIANENEGVRWKR